MFLQIVSESKHRAQENHFSIHTGLLPSVISCSNSPLLHNVPAAGYTQPQETPPSLHLWIQNNDPHSEFSNLSLLVSNNINISYLQKSPGFQWPYIQTV